MIVMKFGGTSMGSAATIGGPVLQAVRAAVEGGRNPVVVVSAMSGVTNQLLNAAQAAVERNVQGLTRTLDEVKKRHIEALGYLAGSGARQPFEEAIAEEIERLRVFLEAVAVVGELSCRSKDVVLAVGEKLSARLLTAALEGSGVNARYVSLDTLIQGRLNFGCEAYWREVQQLLKHRLEEDWPESVPVVTGFFGPTETGILNSVGRGYSDFCASLAGAALGAEEIQIWTDVDGVLSTNPKVVPEAFLLPQVSFDEMAELAHFGAKVLHPHSVAPALNADVPIRILNTFNPQCEGTRVCNRTTRSTLPFKSISYKKGVTILRIASPVMLFAHGYIARLGRVFADHKISIDLIATSEVSVSLSVEQSPQALEALVEELRTLGQVTVHGNQSILCLVGVEMGEGYKVPATVFAALEGAGIVPRMFTMGDARINLSLVVDDCDCERAVILLHRRFFPQPAEGSAAQVPGADQPVRP